ncbi:hypothetical protein DRN93_01000 [archaeon]|nr:MAG: hypothetical protein DRN93_01000 [archaeon]
MSNEIWGILIKDLKSFLREKEVLFWYVAFPLMLMFLYSAIFGGESSITLDLGVVDYSQDELSNSIVNALNETKIFDMAIYDNTSAGLSLLDERKLDILLVIPEGLLENITRGRQSSLKVYIESYNPNTAQLSKSVIEGFFIEFNRNMRKRLLDEMAKYMPSNLSYNGYTFTRETLIGFMISFSEPLNVSSVEYIRGGRTVTYKEFLLAGLFGYIFLFSGMSGVAFMLAAEKVEGHIKRIKASIAKPINILIGKTLAELLLVLLNVAIIIGTSIILLRPAIYLDFIVLTPLIIIGAVNGIAIGLLLATLSPSPRAAGSASIAVATFLQFFIGLYFPLEIFPAFLRGIAEAIPFTKVVEAIRLSLLEGVGWEKIYPDVFPLIVLGVILYSLSVLSYRRWVKK